MGGPARSSLGSGRPTKLGRVACAALTAIGMLLGGTGKRARMSPKTNPNASASASWACLRDGKSHSRLLYANPVCLLLTGPQSCAFAAHRTVPANEAEPGTLGAVSPDAAGAPRAASLDAAGALRAASPGAGAPHAHEEHRDRDNAMVISWLSPVNNRGTLMLSINRKRHSSAWVLQRRCFALAVATTELEDALLRVGACSGRDRDKLGGDAPLVSIATVPLTQKKAKGCPHTEIQVVAGSVALLHCHVTQISANVDEQHWVIFAKVEACYADQRYWNGTVLSPTNKHLPKLISFLGSQRFAAIDATDNRDAATDAHD